MSKLLLVNPKKRKKTMATKKQLAALKKARAALKRKRAASSSTNRRRIKRNPAKRTAATSTRKRVSVNAASRRTKKSPTARLKARRKKNTVTGYYPNPRRRVGIKDGIKNAIDNQLKPAAMQAAGALALDVGMGYFGGYLPAQLNSGMARHATKGVIAMILGYVAANFVGNQTANTMVKGALTVTLHDAGKDTLAQFAPSLPMGYYNPAPVLNYYSSDNGNGGIGYYSNDTGDGYSMGNSIAYDSATIEG